MTKLLLGTAGGAIGAGMRYLIAGWTQRLTGGTFPSGTLVVNVLGCLLIGVAAALFAGPHLIRDAYRIGLTIGLLGGFTTFSTYAWESVTLAQEGAMARAAMNILVSNFAGLIAAWIGYRVGQSLFGA